MPKRFKVTINKCKRVKVEVIKFNTTMITMITNFISLSGGEKITYKGLGKFNFRYKGCPIFLRISSFYDQTKCSGLCWSFKSKKKLYDEVHASLDKYLGNYIRIDGRLW